VVAEAYSVDVGVLLASFVNLLVDRKKGFRCSPVHLGNELAAEGIDDSCYTGS